MSKDVLMRLTAEINEAKEEIEKAMNLAHSNRGLALNSDAIMYAKAFKEIEYILRDVLER